MTQTVFVCEYYKIETTIYPNERHEYVFMNKIVAYDTVVCLWIQRHNMEREFTPSISEGLLLKV